MRQYKFSIFVTICLFFICHQAMAAFVLNGTRFIYDEGKKNISLQVTNSTDKTYGGQVWVNNTNQGDDIYMAPTPPFFKIAPKQTQTVRIMNINDSLPKERESLFWINVQEVPPKPKNVEGNVFSIAMNTQVKLIYRPKSLQGKRENAEALLQRREQGGYIYLKNPTPYYFAITEIKLNDKMLKLSREVANALVEMAPFSEVALGNIGSGKLTVNAVNDWGGVQEYGVK